MCANDRHAQHRLADSCLSTNQLASADQLQLQSAGWRSRWNPDSWCWHIDTGSELLANEPKRWKDRLKGLRKIDWLRSNKRLWEGRAMVGGRVSKAHNNVLLTAIVIKRALGLSLSPEEQKVESNFGKRGV